MIEWYWWLGGGVIGIVIALLFEDVRDWMGETFQYIISFEWWGDLWGFVTSAFEGLGEFSFYGLAFGFATAGTLFLLSKWTLQPFLVYYDTSGKILWTIITYVGTFIAGYLMGKAFENSS